MRRKISSGWTPIYKLFPFVWVVGMGLGLANGFSKINGVADVLGACLFLFLILAGGMMGFAYSSLKEVYIDGANLWIGGFLQAAEVPFPEIVEVNQSQFFRPVTISIKFKTATRFGDEIKFIPDPYPSGFIPPLHPIVSELRELVGLK